MHDTSAIGGNSGLSQAVRSVQLRVQGLVQLLQQLISLPQVCGRFGGRKFRPRRDEQVSCLGAPVSASAHEQAREADRGPQFPTDCL